MHTLSYLIAFGMPGWQEIVVLGAVAALVPIIVIVIVMNRNNDKDS